MLSLLSLLERDRMMSIDSMYGHNADHTVVWAKKMAARLPSEQEVANCRRILGEGPEFTRLFSGWGRAQGKIDALVRSHALA